MKIEEKQILAKAQIIARLREVADGLEAGTFALGGHEIEIPENAELQLEFKSKKGKNELALEIEWTTPGGESADGKVRTLE